MKLIDFDGIFNNKMAKMIEKHAAEHTESEWEDLIADLYKKFGDTPLKELGATPRAYFGAMSESALVETLKEYLLQNISVPDFLCEALEGRDCTEPLLKLLYETDEQLVQYAINLLNTNPKAAVRYAEMLKEDAYDEHVKDSLADMLKPNADLVLEEVLALCKDKETEPYALEILSKLKNKDDRAYAALMNAFLAADDRERPFYAPISPPTATSARCPFSWGPSSARISITCSFRNSNSPSRLSAANTTKSAISLPTKIIRRSWRQKPAKYSPKTENFYTQRSKYGLAVRNRRRGQVAFCVG